MQWIIKSIFLKSKEIKFKTLGFLLHFFKEFKTDCLTMQNL